MITSSFSTTVSDSIYLGCELKSLDQWVIWRRIPRGARKPAKVPFNPHSPSAMASVTDSSSWGSYELSRSALEERGVGLGFVLTERDPFSVIDLDKCRDPQSGLIAPWARATVQRFESFTEISPSGTGLHIWLKAHLPGGGRRQGSIEVYFDRRFIAFTGELLPGSPLTIEDRQETLDEWIAETFSAPVQRRRMEKTRVGWGISTKPASRFPQCTDEDVLRKAEQAPNGTRFRSLFHDGDLTPYEGDHSCADQALCGLLAYWTNDNPDQMDRLFRRSALMRPKWDESRGDLTYGEKTIQTAIEGRL